MLQHIRLRKLVYIGFALPVVLLFTLTGLIWSASIKVANSLHQIEKAEKAVTKVDEMNIALLLMVRDFRGYLLFEKEDLVKIVEQNWQVFDAAFTAANEAIENPIQKKRLENMRELGKFWKEEFADDVIQKVKSGKKKEGLEITIAGKGITRVTEFDKVSREFKNEAVKALKLAQLETQDTLRDLVILAVGGTILAVAIAIVAATFISAKIGKKIEQETQVIAQAAVEIAATVEQQERASNNQASAVNQTTTTMNELNTSLQQSSQQADATAKGSRDALVLTEGGTKAVEKTLDGMETLKVKVEAIANQILHLSEQTHQIDNISRLVSELANQTNMLALNAAVEAVRAGEHGKGFAIVAAEIRKLADESKKSATKISDLIADIQNANNMTVLVTDEGIKTAETGVQISHTTATAFEGIINSINDIVVNNQQISLNIRQQAIAMQQVMDAMNAINLASQETSGGIVQVKIGVQRLKDAAQNLQAVV